MGTDTIFLVLRSLSGAQGARRHYPQRGFRGPMPTLFGNAARPTLTPLRRFYPLYAPITDEICGETKFKSCLV